MEVVGIYSIKKIAEKGKRGDKITAGIRKPYIRVIGLEVSYYAHNQAYHKL